MKEWLALKKTFLKNFWRHEIFFRNEKKFVEINLKNVWFLGFFAFLQKNQKRVYLPIFEGFLIPKNTFFWTFFCKNFILVRSFYKIRTRDVPVYSKFTFRNFQFSWTLFFGVLEKKWYAKMGNSLWRIVGHRVRSPKNRFSEISRGGDFLKFLDSKNFLSSWKFSTYKKNLTWCIK